MRIKAGVRAHFRGAAIDGVGDEIAPGVLAQGGGEFVLGEANGLKQSLREEGHGARGARPDVAASDGGEQASEDDGNVAGGNVAAEGKGSEVVSELRGGAVAGVAFGVVVAEVGMSGETEHAATAAIGEREATQGHTVLWV